MAMLSSEREKKCPLCAEEMDWTDKQLKPCKCGYEVCVWCWHQIMDMAEKDKREGRCPACRAPYDKEKIVGMEAKCERLVTKKEREIKPQKPKPKKLEERKDLSNVRVIQRKMAYVTGLPLSLADEDLLQQKDYFGRYGKVCKISLSRTAGGTIQQFINDSCSVYATYSKEEEAIRCIRSVHGFVLEGRSLRASFGTAKYCHVWLKNMLCNNPACLYLHAFGADEDSFGKDEEAVVHMRNRVHQVVGATQNMKQRSGIMLPPPLDVPYNGSSIATEKFISHSMERELHSNRPLTCSMSSKDQDVRIKAPNRSFVDVVARPSSGPDIGNVDEDQKLQSVSSDFSSISIDENFPDAEHSNGMPLKVSPIDQSPRAVLDKDYPHYAANSFREPECYRLPLPAKDTQHYAAKSLGDHSKHSMSDIADCMKEQSFSGADSSHNNLEEDLIHSDDQASVLTSTDNMRDSSNGYVQHCKKDFRARNINVDCTNANNYSIEVSVPFGVANSSSVGFTETKIHSHSNSVRKIRSSNSLNEEIVGQFRRLDGRNLSINSDSSALDAVESNIVSSISSIDFDSCGDSLSLSHSFTELYGGSDGRLGSLWNSSKNDQSRFSFTKEDNYVKKASDFMSSFGRRDQGLKEYSLFSDYMHKDSVEIENLYSSGPQNKELRTQSFAPPGFSVTPKDPPPGFASYERTNQLQSASSGSYSVSTASYLNRQTRSAGNFDFIEPAMMAVHGGKSTNEVSSGLDSWQASTTRHTTYDNDARFWLLMQQAGATKQGSKFTPAHVQDLPFLHQDSEFSYTGNNYGVNSWITADQNQTYIPSYSQFSQQKYGNGRVSNGYRSSWDEIRPKHELGMPEIQRNDRLGFDTFFSSRRDLLVQVPSTGNVCNRVYGL